MPFTSNADMVVLQDWAADAVRIPRAIHCCLGRESSAAYAMHERRSSTCSFVQSQFVAHAELKVPDDVTACATDAGYQANTARAESYP